MPITYENHPKYDVVCNNCGKTFTGIYGERCPDCTSEILKDICTSPSDLGDPVLAQMYMRRLELENARLKAELAKAK